MIREYDSGLRGRGRPARALIALWVAVLSLGAALSGAAQEAPNILWLTVEDMSPTLGCYGDEYATTPHIDALAKQSVRYTHAFATAPVCSPARSCLITGCYATTLGTQRLRSAFPIPEHMLGFPALLRDRGYYCTNNVKTDYNTSRERQIIAASWDESSATAHWRNRPAGKPFFAVFNDMTTHQSRSMVWPYEQFQKNVQSELKPSEIHDPAQAPVPPYYPDTPLVRRTVARYYDCVTAMDKHIGVILRQLEEDGLADDTIVFFYSDHGSGMPRHKRALLDSGMHVPLLIRFPQKYRHLAPSPPGSTCDRLVSFVDFPATLLSVCGITIPDYMQGVPFLGSASGTPRRYVFGARDRVDEVFDLARSVRDEKFLYIRNYMPYLSYHQPSAWPDQGAVRREMTEYARAHFDELSPAAKHYLGPRRPVEELYDAQTDPMNLRNLANDPAHAATLKRMRRALRSWVLQSRDLGFLPEEDAWQRSAGATPYSLRHDRDKLPLSRIFDAAEVVGRSSDSLAECRRLLRDEDPAVRYWAVIALANLGDEAGMAKAELRAALEDEAAAVRIEAANVLVRLGEPQRAWRVLRQSLQDEEPSVVLHAARTVELMGARASVLRDDMEAARRRLNGGNVLNMFIEFSTDAFLKQLDASASQGGNGEPTR